MKTKLRLHNAVVISTLLIRVTYGYIRIHTSTRRTGLSDTNVVLIQVNSYPVYFFVVGLEGGGGTGGFDGPTKVFVQFSRSKINSRGVGNL